MALTLQQVIGQNPHLSQRMLVVQSILSSLRSDGLGVYDLNPAMEIPFSRAAVLWIFGAIVPRGVLAQDGMMVVIQLYRQILLERGEYWERQLEKQQELTPMILTVADRKIVELGGHEGTCYDLQRCQRLKSPPRTFEGISYNLAIPVQLEWHRVQREIKHVADTTTQRSVPGPLNPGGCAPGIGRRSAGPGGAAVGPGDDPPRDRGDAGEQAAPRSPEQGDGGRGAGDN